MLYYSELEIDFFKARKMESHAGGVTCQVFLILKYFGFLIHEADHNSDHYFYSSCPSVRPSIRLSLNFKIELKITTDRPGLWAGRVDH